MFKIKILVTLLVFVLMFGGLYSLSTVQVEKPIIYQLSAGSNVRQVAEELEKLGHIKSSQMMIILTKLLSIGTLKAGYYEIYTNMNLITLLHNFANAKIVARNITLVEGKTVLYYYQQLLNNPALKHNNMNFAKMMTLSGVKAPYEGKFYPETYQINYGDSVLSVFQRAAKMLQIKLNSAWRYRQKNYPLKTPYQALILASLIEQESAYNQEKPHIAAVFINRLQMGMRLQTDPSVIYALGADYKGKLSKKDLLFESPYNTYRNKGLPPQAIGSVGQTSLNAALHPIKSDALYFVSKKDGTHAFANTYKQHQNNIKKYLK